ncbi:MAG: DUF5683 domain-containing protein [Bacteroidota bacterium]
MKFSLVFLVLLFLFTNVDAQKSVKKDTVANQKDRIDTLSSPGYVNRGKIAGKKAIRRSLILPGLGQVYNYGLIVDDIKNNKIEGKAFGKKLAIIGKIGGIYVAGTMLTLSYIDNNQKYNLFLKELQYRALHNGQPDPDGSLSGYKDTNNLITGKNIYKSNREIVLIFLGVTYGVNVLDAYITARLKYLNVDEKLGFNIRPSVINSNTMYGYNSFTPALKLTLKL